MSTDVNILLLGQSGFGKTTFINAFGNYLVHRTLEDAMAGELQAPIPASFMYMDLETYDETKINIGTPCESEQTDDQNTSCTMECRSFIFQIKNRKLRLIDTPAIVDTRGPIQDVENLKNISAFISQYEHLNGICILLKPNEDRLNVLLRYCLKELLRHLHVQAKENIMFVFTNARSRNYLPGRMAPLVRQFLYYLKSDNQNAIPFTKENTFCLDNEAFRLLALCKNGIPVTADGKNDYSCSWSHSIKEIELMMTKIVQCQKHNTHDTVSLNEAQQLIQKLSRPIGEITTLIDKYVVLVDPHNKKISDSTSHQKVLEQVDIEVIEFAHPRLVCTNDLCTKTTIVGGIAQIDYVKHCHAVCYLNGIEENVIGHEKIKSCPVINKSSGKCIKCNCDWKKHMHISYDLRKVLRKINVENRAVIEQRLASLKSEKDAILRVCGQLASFIRSNSMCPINDNILDYIQCLIREEKQKKNVGVKNDEVIAELEKLEQDYRKEIEFMRQFMNSAQNNSSSRSGTITPQRIFDLVRELYHLPLYGDQIRAQIEEIRMAPPRYSGGKEIIVKLPAKAESSPMMMALRGIMA